MDYILERNVPVENLRLDAANLISDAKWQEFFSKMGNQLQTLKLSWLDYSMTEESFILAMEKSKNLRRLKIKKCWKLADASLEAISRLPHLEHLSLRMQSPIESSTLINLIHALGTQLKTLSLENFTSANDDVIHSIGTSCRNLTKLRLTGTDACTDAGLAAFFGSWTNPGLSIADFDSVRDTDHPEPNTSTDATAPVIGLASSAFRALMAHSGDRLEQLNVKSCRHIEYAALAEVFDGVCQYSMLRSIDLSFVSAVDTTIVQGIFRSCPDLKKLVTFGCFGVTDVMVPRGVALIGVPHAQDSIAQVGGF